MKIYPSVFLVPDNSQYKEFIDPLSDWFIENYPKLFYKNNFGVSTEELNRYRPGYETKSSFGIDIDVEHPFIISFVDLTNYQNEGFFEFFEKVKKEAVFKANERSDYRFINVFIRDVSRSSPITTNDWSFYDQFEKFCKDNRSTESNLLLRYVHNIVIDNFNEETGTPLERIDNIFQQLSKQLQLILLPNGINEVKLKNCLATTARSSDSSVRYNTMGFCSVGFNQKRVGECIALKRKSDFLLEILEYNEPDESLKLRIIDRQTEFFNSNYLVLENEFHQKVFVSFELAINPLVKEYIEKCSRQSKTKSNLDFAAKQLFDKIDEQGKNVFHELAKNKEEGIERFISFKLEGLQEQLKLYISQLFDENNTKEAISAVNYGISSLLKEKDNYKISQVEGIAVPTLLNLKKNLEGKRIKLSKIELTDNARENFKIGVEHADENLLLAYRDEKAIKKDLEWHWRSLKGRYLLWIPLVLAILGGVLYFNQNIIVNWLWPNYYKLSACFGPTLLALLNGFYKTYQLKKKLAKVKGKISKLINNKLAEIDKYVGTYTKYYTNFFEYLKVEKLLKLINQHIKTVENQSELVNGFKASLNNLQGNFQAEYQKFELSDSHFDYSLITKKEIEYYCSKNKMLFFENRRISQYFNEFVDNRDYFRLFNYKNLKTETSESEEIAPNESTFSENYAYKKIEAYQTKSFLKGDKERHDVLYTDVKQGRVGDCYFLAALAGIAHKKADYIKALIDPTNSHPYVNFYDNEMHLHKVGVNDKFWVAENDQPIYAQFGSYSSEENTQEIWPMLVEKAWAKINGGDYSEINGDNVAGDLRDLDYSLALSGHKAFRENLVPNTFNQKETISRIKKHINDKPVVLYSRNQTVSTEVLSNHAFALLSWKNDKLKLYDPHGKTFEIEEKELVANFETVLYFDFNYQEDEHLTNLFAEYFTRNADNNLIKEFDAEIEPDLDKNIYSKTLEEALAHAVFNVSMEERKMDEAVTYIISHSIPFVSLYGVNDQVYEVYLLGENNNIQKEINARLPRIGIYANSTTVLQSNEKIMGLLNLRNDLKLNQITKKT